MVSKRLLFPLFSLIFASACERTPPEPQPAAAPTRPTPQAPTVTQTAVTASRQVPAPTAEQQKAPPCVMPTPKDPPPQVKPAAKCPEDPAKGPPKVPMGTVSFLAPKEKPKPGDQPTDKPTDNPKPLTVTVEVMKTEQHRERGLMFRQTMAEDKGMLFVFDDVDKRAFWMRNTCLPLDMLFIAEDGTIVSILENVPTLNETPRESGCAAKYVLELNAGYARRHGIAAGQTVTLSGI